VRRIFESFVLVDWSASSKPVQGEDSIWIAAFSQNARKQWQAPKMSNPTTRTAAEKEINEILSAFAKRGDRTFIGFDFPFGFPAGAAAGLKAPGTAPWRATWDLIASLIKDKPDNDNNRFQVGANFNRRLTGAAFPFWGCPAKDVQTTLSSKRPRDHGAGDLAEMRAADLVAKAQSPWKLFYQGSPGGQAMVGIPVVRRLRDAPERAARSAIWPFETGWAALTPETIDPFSWIFAEIYPSLLPAAPQAGEVKDAAQLRVLGEKLTQLDDEGKLAALFGPPHAASEDERARVVAEEGWIFGAGALR